MDAPFRRKRSAPARRPALPPLVQGLEPRRLLAAAPPPLGTAELAADGTLNIVGTRKHDEITVSLNGATAGQIDVAINSQVVQSFARSAVAAIRVDADKGNDQVTIGAGNDVPATVLGDKGNDMLHGGGGDDNIDGGVGNDDLGGGAGDDFVTGGAGRDRLRGDLGDDDLDGGSGNDDVGGDDGLDRVRGGSGKDRCSGGGGDDRVSGGSGRDDLRGDDGGDTFDDSDARDARGDRFEDRGPGDRSADDSLHINPADAPDAVLAAFNARFPGATAREVEREPEDGGAVIKIDYFDADGLRRRAVFSEAGQFLTDRAHGRGLNNNGGDGGGSGDDDDGGDGGGSGDDDTPGHGGNNGGGDDDGGGSSDPGDGDDGGGGGSDPGDDDDGGGSDGDGDGDGGDDEGGDDGEGEDDDDRPGEQGGEPITLADLPAAVRDAFNLVFPDAVVDEVERVAEGGELFYRFTFTDADGIDRRAVFSAIGQLLWHEVL